MGVSGVVNVEVDKGGSINWRSGGDGRRRWKEVALGVCDFVAVVIIIGGEWGVGR